MKTKMLYICETCGKAHEEREMCLKCEARHVHPAEIMRADYSEWDFNKSGYEYFDVPKYIIVKMDNGKTYSYRKDRKVHI